MTAFEAVTSRPLQIQIADHLARRIISGELPDGEIPESCYVRLSAPRN